MMKRSSSFETNNLNRLSPSWGLANVGVHGCFPVRKSVSMKYVPHLLLTVVMTAIIFVGVSYGVASDVNGRGEGLAHWILFEMRRSEALQQRLEEISRSLEVKKVVIDDLLAKRLTFREAAEAFREADESISQDADGLIAPYHTPQTEEEVRRQVIAWTATELAEGSQQTAEITHRLEMELAEQPCAEESAE
jgi:hypothetical protein